MGVTPAPPAQGLTSAPVESLVRSLAVPASIGFLFQTLFNVVDTYWAGRISTTALAAMALAFPVFFAIIALGGGLAGGVTALVGAALGRGDRRGAAIVAAQGLGLGLAAGLAITAAGLAWSPAAFRLLGADGAYLDDCLAYMNVIFGGAAFFLVNAMLNAVLNATGDTSTYRNFLILGCGLNAALDPWFVHGGLGAPAMGLSGIALATVLIQAGGSAYLWRAARRTGLLDRRLCGGPAPQPPALAAIARQGLPAAVNYALVGLGIFVITWFLSRFGQTTVAAYGVATRIEQIVLLPTIGLNIATLALTAQNYGAGRLDRVRRARAAALRYGAMLMLPAAVPLYLLAEPLMGLFARDPAVLALGAQYLRVAAFVLYAYVLLYVSVASLQGVQRPLFAVWVGLYRQVLAPALVFQLFAVALGYGPAAVWWGVFAVNWSAAAVSALYAGRVLDAVAQEG